VTGNVRVSDLHVKYTQYYCEISDNTARELFTWTNLTCLLLRTWLSDRQDLLV